MLKPERSRIFLPRPISAAFWGGTSGGAPSSVGWLGFLIFQRGKGTEELTSLFPGETIHLSGPLGNCWEDFLPLSGKASGKTRPDTEKPYALIGGGIGIAPLLSLPSQYPDHFDFYAGFRTGFENEAEQACLWGNALLFVKKLVITAELINETAEFHGEKAYPAAEQRATAPHIPILRGRIPDFLNPADYSAVYACGPEGMLRAVAEKCATAGTPCYVSLERRMACGTGACLGCTVYTTEGNRRCCTDGPVFAYSNLI
jgi:NAD(P)H-flavin reductase